MLWYIKSRMSSQKTTQQKLILYMCVCMRVVALFYIWLISGWYEYPESCFFLLLKAILSLIETFWSRKDSNIDTLSNNFKWDIFVVKEEALDGTKWSRIWDPLTWPTDIFIAQFRCWKHYVYTIKARHIPADSWPSLGGTTNVNPTPKIVL